MEVFLKKEICENKNLTNDGLAVYVALRKLMNKEEKKYCLSYNTIAYTLLDSDKIQRRFISHIVDGLQNLIDMELIEVVTNLSKSEFILDLSKLYFETNGKDYFTIITLEEIHLIMQSNRDKFNLLKCFIMTIGTLNHEAFTYLDSSPYSDVKVPIGFMTQEYLGSISGVTQRQYGRYAQELANLGVLYIKRNNDFYLKNGVPKRVTNAYGRPEDKEWIDKYENDYANSKNTLKCSKRTSIKKANSKKSMLMKYNAILKGKVYSDDEVQEIYNFLACYNEELDKLAKKEQDKGYTGESYLEKKKDLSVFDRLIEKI